MSYAQDPRVDEAKLIPVTDLVTRLGIGGLKSMSGELIGPCPLCGGRDRFGIKVVSCQFLCRKCDMRGGDQISLVMGVLGLNFKDALHWIAGDRPAEIDPKELERRQAIAREADRKQREQSERFRQKARNDAGVIWKKSRPGHLGVVSAYLKARGIPVGLLGGIPKPLRFIADHPYVKKIDGRLVTAFTGPCMIALIQSPDGKGAAVHQTWVDPEPPHGKAKIVWDGVTHASKLVRGSKKSGAIRLHTPEGAETLVMGEGIETTLTAMAARPFQNAAYWAGVDLGNMSGRMKKIEGKRYSGLPDLSVSEAFVPPPWVKRLIFIMDGDSEPNMTRAKLECGLQRAMALRTGLKARIVKAGDGVDLNDVLVAANSQEGTK